MYLAVIKFCPKCGKELQYLYKSVCGTTKELLFCDCGYQKDGLFYTITTSTTSFQVFNNGEE